MGLKHAGEVSQFASGMADGEDFRQVLPFNYRDFSVVAILAITRDAIVQINYPNPVSKRPYRQS